MSNNYSGKCFKCGRVLTRCECDKQPKELTIQITDKHWAVEVPDDAEEFSIDMDEEESTLYYFNGANIDSTAICLPEGSWQFLFTTKEATEEDARKIVTELPVENRYENYNGDYPVWWHTAKESIRSLLKSKGCDTNKNYAIIEKL